MSEALASLRLLTRTAFQLSPVHALASFFEVGGLVLQRLAPLWVAMLVAGVTGSDRSQTVAGATGLAVSLGLGSAFVLWGVNSRLRMLDLVGHHFDHELAALVGTTPTLEPLQSGTLRETLQIIKDRLGALGGSFNSLVGALNGVIPPIASVVVAIAIDWRLAFLTVATLPSLAHARWALKWEERAEDEGAAAGLISGEWGDAVTGGAHDELRSYAALGWARDHAVAQTRAWRRPMAIAESRSAWLGVACDLIYSLTALLVLVWIVTSPVNTAATAAVLVAMLLVSTDMREGFEGLRSATEMLGHALRTLSRYRTVVSELGPPPKASAIDFGHGMRMHDVSFTYPGSDAPAVDGIDVDLPPGSIIAVVGENGSGKSTLVTLLLGLHQPQRGTITAGSVELTRERMDAWREHCAAVYQDHTRFQMSVCDGVGIGDMVRTEDAAEQQPLDGPRVDQALERGGAEELVAALPQGKQTLVGPDLGGRDLSGGQWQRLATARGMLRDAPALFVLDEPTSALDPHAEAALIDRLMARAEQLRRTGGVVIIVTHRLTTTRHVDLVLVMHQGRLVESGAMPTCWPATASTPTCTRSTPPSTCADDRCAGSGQQEGSVGSGGASEPEGPISQPSRRGSQAAAESRKWARSATTPVVIVPAWTSPAISDRSCCPSSRWCLTVAA